jgi:hypothetical protein
MLIFKAQDGDVAKVLTSRPIGLVDGGRKVIPGRRRDHSSRLWQLLLCTLTCNSKGSRAVKAGSALVHAEGSHMVAEGRLARSRVT